MKFVVALIGLLLASPAFTQQVPSPMSSNAINAKLPEAMTNLLSQGATITGGLMTATPPESAYQYFGVPGWGPCCYKAGSIFSGTGGAHSGELRATVNINRDAEGSTAFGPPHSDVALMVSAGKKNFLTSNIEGEIDALYIQATQGRKGDVGGLVVGTSKVKSGTADDNGGIATIETAAVWIDAAGNRLWEVHALPGFGAAGAEQSNGGGYGMFVESHGPDAAGAANRIMPYSGYAVSNYDIAGLCPPTCTPWQNVLTAASMRSTDPNSIYFQVSAGPAASGDIRMGSGWSAFSGTPTQSGGNKLTLQNVGGNFRMLANNGTTPSFTLSQGPSPVLAMQSTTLGPAAGGLWRQVLNSFDGTMLWQKNTAAAGDFSTAETMFALDYNRARIIGSAAGLELRDNSSAITVGGLWRVGSTAGFFSIIKNTAAAGDFSTATAYLSVDPTGGVQLPTLPTSAGGGGLAVCVDSGGTLYKKAACP